MKSNLNILTIEFLKLGMLTQFQDLGRPGYQSFGIPLGGALDQPSAEIANKLVGNSSDQPVFEITLLGPKIKFSASAQIAITGGDLSPKIDDQSIPMYETVDVQEGNVLSFGRIKSGCRAYLAIRGEWILNKWLNSASPIELGDSNLTPNLKISKNDKIEIGIDKNKATRKWEFDSVQIESSIRVIKGPEFKQFPEEFIDRFLQTEFTISPNSNRMGYRLDPPIAGDLDGGSLISSGIVPGTIQITPSGQPIILLNDAQTIGGYARIANVISDDLPKLAQAKPGDFIKFTIEH